MNAPEDLVAGRYRRQNLVGSGGMGTVWDAWDELLDRRVAVKQLKTPPGLTQPEADLANQRAMREARITARLSHRYAVPVFDVVEHEGRPCIVMPFIGSVPLSTVLREGGPLDVDEAAGVGAQIAAALTAAHAVGIVHRDVKPGNILVADDGAALISDFGISRALGDVTLTSTGDVHGTPAYLAPEVARGGEATAASDVFALGSTLYAALEGAPPFGAEANSIALLHKVAAGRFPPPRQAGPLTSLLAAMLASDPADRPPMGMVASRLRALSSPAPVPAADESDIADAAPAAATRPTEAPPVDPDPAGSGPERRRGRSTRVLAAVLALVVAGVLAGLVWVQVDSRSGTVAGQGGSGPTAVDPSTVPPASPRPSSTPATTGTDSSAPSASTRATSAPAATPTAGPRPTASPRSTITRAPGSPSADDLTGAVRGYYALMPTGTDQAWPRMTAWYQTNHAGGRAAYERFWGQFSRVTVSNVSAQPPDRAVATLTYYFKSGRVDVERTAFRMVTEGGRLKISRTTVLSRVSRGAGP